MRLRLKACFAGLVLAAAAICGNANEKRKAFLMKASKMDFNMGLRRIRSSFFATFPGKATDGILLEGEWGTCQSQSVTKPTFVCSECGDCEHFLLDMRAFVVDVFEHSENLDSIDFSALKTGDVLQIVRSGTFPSKVVEGAAM